MNEEIIQTELFLFAVSDLTRKEGPSSLKLERWQGPPRINKIKWYEIVSSFKVSHSMKIFLSPKTT